MKLDSKQVDGRIEKGGLYNGVKPSKEGDQKILMKNIEEDSL